MSRNKDQHHDYLMTLDESIEIAEQRNPWPSSFERKSVDYLIGHSDEMVKEFARPYGQENEQVEQRKKAA